MTGLLKGRYGDYAPRNAEERSCARKQAEKRRLQQNLANDWLERTRWCTNGCGKEAARYDDSPGHTLRFDGACSPECQAAVEARRGASTQTGEKSDVTT